MRAAVLVEYNNEEIKITIATNLQRNPIWWIILDVFAYAKKKKRGVFTTTILMYTTTLTPLGWASQCIDNVRSALRAV